MLERLLVILSEVRPDLDFENETHLIDDDLLDSFDIISIVSECNDVFDVEISVDDLEPENFNSAEAIAALIERLQED
jgi:acyl carrier protein